MHADDFNNQRVYTIGPLDLDGNPSKVLAKPHSTVSAVHYSPAKKKQSHISSQTVIQNDYASRLVQD